MLHIASDEGTNLLQSEWEEFVEAPSRELGINPPKLIVIPSPYRFVIHPIVDYVLQLSREKPDRQIAVLIPEVVERKWYYHMLHNQRAAALKTMLYFKGDPSIVVINIPWYVKN